jgi:regulator of CtrA degradation
MRLTTRLLELASWLMIRRALKSGEISAEEARTKRQRVKLKGPGRPSHVKGFLDLPLGLQQLVEQSFSLNDRILQLDRAMELALDATTPADNPVGAQVSRLQEAFAHTRRRAGAREPRPTVLDHSR